MSWLWVALGSAIGGVARYWFGVLVAAKVGTGFPWGTLLVNVSGSLLIGLAAALTDARGAQGTRDFLMTGVLGGFTTFSAFSLQTLMLLREDRVLHAGANIAASIALCLAAVWLGYAIGNALKPVA